MKKDACKAAQEELKRLRARKKGQRNKRRDPKLRYTVRLDELETW